jgi:hypothetical protein
MAADVNMSQAWLSGTLKRRRRSGGVGASSPTAESNRTQCAIAYRQQLSLEEHLHINVAMTVPHQ